MTKSATEAITKADAIMSLKPYAKWSMSGDVVTWLDSSHIEPTASEIDAELTRLRTEYTNKKYQRDRAAEYPSYGEQLDYIFHHGVAKWKTDIVQPVKDKFPKPS
tara:strand:+ start:163 stop:477 length:315 start_codon:yes stop_codon:yes gene_type:complete